MKIYAVTLLALVAAVAAAPEEPVVAIVSPGPVAEQLLAAESSVANEPLVIVAAPTDLVKTNVSAPAKNDTKGSGSDDQATAAGGHFGGPEYGKIYEHRVKSD
ncbi:unnamed protein product [Orchesella dallaii]|uniref:Uncharacterized protein n=1 Tax=Orchesella dallaii TaxID=48710 RepID=A0ABP1S1R6_9HEXA